jgi:tetratricopeptide (TPR) repeat protein
MFLRAVAFQQAGELPRAIEIYNLLLTRDELAAESHNNLGLVHQQRGQLEDAAREFENSLAHDPRYAPAHYNLGVLYDRSGERDRAAAHYRAFLEHRGNDHAALTPDVTSRIAALGAAR